MRARLSLLPLALLSLFACDPEEHESTPTGGLDADAQAIGECKSTPDGPTTDTAGYTPTFSMTADVTGSTVVLHLVDVTANCCPSPGASVSTEGSILRVDFQDVTSDTSCDCMCVFDFDVTLTDVPSGTWTVALYDDGEAMGTVDVTVPEVIVHA